MGKQKMYNLEVGILLEEYKGWVSAGSIKFLDGEDRDEVLRLVDGLIVFFPKEKGKNKRKDPKWHDVHKKAIELWGYLASCALKDIDPTSKGNSKLFEFLNASAKFEDLLYGLESYYRDHTLHSLWVYLVGEFIMRTCLKDKSSKLNWYLFNDLERDVALKEASYPISLVEAARIKKDGLESKVNQKRDAIWCLMALCHDLGYSLSKLDRLNDRVKDVLEFIELPNFRGIGYSLDVEHQYNVTQLLDLMALDVRIVPVSGYSKKEVKKKEDEKDSQYKARLLKAKDDDLLIKCYKDDSTYWRLCRAIEQKQHGILSSYLIYKMLGIFADTWVRGPAEEWGIEKGEAIDTIIRGDILFAIAQHEFEFAHMSELSSLADILVLADELEEFSRLGRDLLTRHYRGTMAKSQVGFNPVKLKNSEYK